MKKISAYISGASAIIGSIIGAGFITGREIATFFCIDLSVSGIYLCLIMFFICFYLIMSYSGNGKVYNIIKKAVAVSNIVIASCMLGAVENIFHSFLRQTEFVKILKIITMIFAFFICCKGIGGISKISAALIPVALILLTVILVKKTQFSNYRINISPSTGSGIIMPPLYVGMNVFMSFSVIKDACVSKTKKSVCIISAISALTLIFFVALISYIIKSNGLDSFDMPLLYFLRSDLKAYVLMEIICFIGIFSTLICALYSAFTLTSGKYALPEKIILALLAYSLSNIGFANIVNNLYPVFGVLGFIVCVIIFLQEFFQARRPKRTLRPLKCIK